MSSTDQSYERGWATRIEVLGAEHVDRTASRWTEFDMPLRDFVVRSAFGEVWARPELDRRTRSAVTLGILTTLRAEDELALHVRAAARNGLTVDEIREVLLHTAVYAGVPAALRGFATAKAALEQTGDLPTGSDDG